MAHSVTNTSMVISWLPPLDFGGRNPEELFYAYLITSNPVAMI